MMRIKHTGDTSSYNKKWYPAPPCSTYRSGIVEGVWLNPGETVHWYMSYFEDGSQGVTGYTIVYLPPPICHEPIFGQCILNSNESYVARYRN